MFPSRSTKPLFGDQLMADLIHIREHPEEVIRYGIGWVPNTNYIYYNSTTQAARRGVEANTIHHNLKSHGWNVVARHECIPAEFPCKNQWMILSHEMIRFNCTASDARFMRYSTGGRTAEYQASGPRVFPAPNEEEFSGPKFQPGEFGKNWVQSPVCLPDEFPIADDD
jgi:hypothetical protein